MSWRDRRKGGGGGGGSGLSREVQVSKKLSWLLRHGAEKEGLKLGPGGYINVEEVVSPDWKAFYNPHLPWQYFLRVGNISITTANS
jgi:hypothetical protein